MPTYLKLQYAGSMGFLSAGTGWDSGKRNQFETDIYIGFIPKFSTDEVRVTFTLKQNYIPWKINIKKHFNFEPFTCGLYVTTMSGENLCIKAPKKYPKGYYWLAPQARWHFFNGQRVSYRRFTFFYEVSSIKISNNEAQYHTTILT
jgi:hypothetical protein